MLFFPKDLGRNVKKILSSNKLAVNSQQVLMSDQAQLWRLAMLEEINSMKENDVELVKPVPNKKLLNTKWVFKEKRKAVNR